MAGSVVGLRVEGQNLHALVHQFPDQRQRRRVPHVVRFRLERQPQNANPHTVQGAVEVLAQGVQRQHALAVVDVDDRAQQVDTDTAGQRQVIQGAHVLGETRAAIAHAGVYAGASTGVHGQPLADSIDGGADAIAQQGDFVDEGDAGGQKSVAGVLDHLGAGDVGDQMRRVDAGVHALDDGHSVVVAS